MGGNMPQSDNTPSFDLSGALGIGDNMFGGMVNNLANNAFGSAMSGQQFDSTGSLAGYMAKQYGPSLFGQSNQQVPFSQGQAPVGQPPNQSKGEDYSGKLTPALPVQSTQMPSMQPMSNQNSGGGLGQLAQLAMLLL